MLPSQLFLCGNLFELNLAHTLEPLRLGALADLGHLPLVILRREEIHSGRHVLLQYFKPFGQQALLQQALRFKVLRVVERRGFRLRFCLLGSVLDLEGLERACARRRIVVLVDDAHTRRTLGVEERVELARHRLGSLAVLLSQERGRLATLALLHDELDCGLGGCLRHDRHLDRASVHVSLPNALGFGRRWSVDHECQESPPPRRACKLDRGLLLEPKLQRFGGLAVTALQLFDLRLLLGLDLGFLRCALGRKAVL
mmetsp:Transcript_20370/g.47326  ORF Transcript_20370/g.47326 Transcript_20370/m.47326 type:complete len:256 (-) Transcript_20370:461-1228(-)